MASIQIVEADLQHPAHVEAVLSLLDGFSCDPLGNGQPLSKTVRDALIPGLRAHPTTVILLALRGDEPLGIAVCFRGFSTFAAKPLLNLHDLFVLKAARGLGVGRELLEGGQSQSAGDRGLQGDPRGPAPQRSRPGDLRRRGFRASGVRSGCRIGAVSREGSSAFWLADH